MDERATTRQYKFAEKNNLDFHFVSAADGTNVVKVFEDILKKAIEFKKNPSDDYLLYEMMDEVSDSFFDNIFRKRACSQKINERI